MKTKTTWRSSVALTITVAGLVIACNKNNSAGSSSSSGTTPGQVETQTDDETQVNNEMDASANDVNNALNTQSAVSGNTTTGYSSGIQTTGGPTGGLDIDYSICDGTVTMDTARTGRFLTPISRLTTTSRRTTSESAERRRITPRFRMDISCRPWR